MEETSWPWLVAMVEASPSSFIDLHELQKLYPPPEEVAGQEALHGEPWLLMVFQQWNLITTANFAKAAQELCQHGQASCNYKVDMNETISKLQLLMKLMPKFSWLLQ